MQGTCRQGIITKLHSSTLSKPRPKFAYGQVDHPIKVECRLVAVGQKQRKRIGGVFKMLFWKWPNK